MHYEFPLMEEEVKAYIVSGEVNLDDLLDCRPGQLIKHPGPIHTMTTLRQWWQPIEDEI
jgi:hypothetical protein